MASVGVLARIGETHNRLCRDAEARNATAATRYLNILIDRANLTQEERCEYEAFVAQLEKWGYEHDDRDLLEHTKLHIAKQKQADITSIEDEDILQAVTRPQLMLANTAPILGQSWVFLMYTLAPESKMMTHFGISENVCDTLAEHNLGKHPQTKLSKSSVYKWELGAVIGPYKFRHEAERTLTDLQSKNRGISRRYYAIRETGIAERKAVIAVDYEERIQKRIERLQAAAEVEMQRTGKGVVVGKQRGKGRRSRLKSVSMDEVRAKAQKRKETQYKKRARLLKTKRTGKVG